jgi:hypothetical protein
MTRVRELAVGLARPAGRLVRPVVALLVRVVVALAALWWAVGVVGELVVSAVLGPALVVWGVARWAALERRLDNHPAPASRAVVVAGGRRVDQGGEHVAFARALVAVSARYLAHCEDQADTHTRMEGWR